MRTLVIAGEYPWPEDRGSRIRLAMVLRGLRRCGPTELFSVVSKFRTDFDPPDEALGLARVGRVGFDNRPATGIHLLPTLWRPSMPIGLPWRDRHRVQMALARFMSGRYDLVWVFGARAWVLAGTPSSAPTILDLDDLEDQKIVARLSVPVPPAPGLVKRARRAGSILVSQEEVRRWQRLHRQAGGRTSTTVVCSLLDAERARANGVAKVEVIPNGYPDVVHPVGRTAVGSPPIVLFQGLLSYPPNVEAARLLAHEVGPALRAVVPDVRIRLVGAHNPDLSALHDPPRVTVVGRVPDITAELARADLVVVPIRYGSGTRLKIIEAFAHRVPVVSTTLGAEGLDAEDGVHLLLGDNVPALADACARLLTQTALREVVATNAHALFVDRFRTDVVEERVSRLARDVAARSPSRPARGACLHRW